MEYVFVTSSTNEGIKNIIICSEVPVNMHVEILHVGNSILVLQSKE